jgi:hypothetical protein
MSWLVVESPVIPDCFRLHSKAEWNSMERADRVWFNVVKECATEEEANAVLDELRKGQPRCDP